MVNIKAYFEVEMRTTIALAVIGIIVGYASFLANNAVYAFIAMLAVAGISIFALKTLLKVKQEFKWWFGNGLIIYIFLWLVTWTIFYNIGLR